VIGSGISGTRILAKNERKRPFAPFVLLPEIATLHCGISLAIVITVQSLSVLFYDLVDGKFPLVHRLALKL